MNIDRRGPPGAWRRALLLMLAQVLLLGVVGGKLIYDRSIWPRGWVQTLGLDPDLPIRGRYLRLSAAIPLTSLPQAPDGDAYGRDVHPVRLEVAPDTARVRGVPIADQSSVARVRAARTPQGERVWALTEPLVYFLPEGAPDPSRLAPGETLWSEVTVTPEGRLRPIRLGVRRGGSIEALDLD